MPVIQKFAAGNYRFLTHQFQYSGGVAADPGYRIERARLVRPLPLAEGFDAIEAHLTRIGRPYTAMCACELRSPGQFTDAGFIAFNRHYVGRLAQWGTFRDDVNPVARSNVCPEVDPPATPSFYAFCYTVPGTVPGDEPGHPSFVIAGSGEAGEGPGDYAERIIRFGDTSPAGMRDKARFVLGAMEQRMAPFGLGWGDVTVTQLYTVFEVHGLIAEEFVARGAASGGVTWHYARPPVQGLDFEVDVRGFVRELVI